MSSDTDFDLRKKIFDEIKKFSRTEQEELFRILKKNSEEVSENRNGIFFDLLSLKTDTIEKIQEWLKFCSENRQAFEERERTITELSKATDT